jgi:hypothetical protein
VPSLPSGQYGEFVARYRSHFLEREENDPPEAVGERLGRRCDGGGSNG